MAEVCLPRWRGLRWAVNLMLVLTTVLACGALLFYQVIRPLWYDDVCRGNLAQLTRAMIEHDIFIEKDGQRLFPDECPTSANVPLRWWTCPACGAPCVYSPVAPSGERLEAGANSGGGYFVLWCPVACHKKGGKPARNCVGNDFWVGSVTDQEVSWYYQRLLLVPDAKLSPEELMKENEYREKMHLPPLEQKATDDE